MRAAGGRPPAPGSQDQHAPGRDDALNTEDIEQCVAALPTDEERRAFRSFARTASEGALREFRRYCLQMRHSGFRPLTAP